MVTRNAVTPSTRGGPAPAGHVPRTAEGRPAGFATGAEARARSEAAQARQNQEQELRGQGLDLETINRYRYRMKEGDEGDIIILDTNLEHVTFADEHQMWDGTAKENVFEFCPREHSHCPLCDGIDRGSPSYTMFLTVLDLRGAKIREVFYPHVKRLMAVKNNLHPEFFKLHDAAVREFGTMRGMQLLMARDGVFPNATGHPIMLPSGKMFEMVSEEALVQEFGHEEVRDGDRLVKSADYDIQPFQYLRLFRQPSGEDLRQRYGAGAPAGSREDTQRTWRGVQQTMDNGGGEATGGPGGGASGNRVRTRSQLAPSTAPASDGIPEPAQAAPATPAAPVTPPPRTRSRPAPAVSSPGPQAAPEAPAPVATAPGVMQPRARTRTPPAAAAPAAPKMAAAIVRRANNATVQNDLDPNEPF